MKKISLVQMQDNQKARIVEVPAGGRAQERFMSLGMYVGKEITKISSFALKGPVTIKVDRAVFALGHGMASKVFVETE